MEKPSNVFDRDREWRDLARFVGQQEPGATLGVVYGRRRQGKTYLLDAVCQAAGGFYFGATEATETESLHRLGAELGRHRGLSTPIALADWHQAVDALLDLGLETPVPVVLDEFPYLVQASPALPSIIQHAYGPRRSQRARSRTRLLLCGSALSFMGRLLTGNAPLRGRAGLEMVVQTLDYRLAAEFWSITDPRLAVLLHSVVGGTPAYRREFIHDDTPDGLDDFDPWVVRNALGPSSPLFREARHLLAEEPGLRDAALYHSVLGAVASGNHTRGGIASAVGRKANDLSHPITVLEDAGLLYREEDAFRQGRTRYTVAEPLVTFYHAVMRPQWSRLGRLGQAERVWSDSRDRFLGSVVGPHFESLCREWTAYYAASETLGGSPARVTAGVVTDPDRRRSYEIDVAAFGIEPGSRRQLLAIGEAKWGETVGVEHLERLSHVREVLRRRDGLDASGTRLVLFAGAGFTADLQGRARSDSDIILVDLDRLYNGD